MHRPNARQKTAAPRHACSQWDVSCQAANENDARERLERDAMHRDGRLSFVTHPIGNGHIICKQHDRSHCLP